MTLNGEQHPRWNGGRAISGRYVGLLRPNHPRAIRGRYVREHFVVVEERTGIAVQPPHEVHHINGNGLDNRPGNLVVCENHAYHFLLHQRERALDACGNAGWRLCNRCRQYDDPNNLYLDPNGRHAHHRSCHARYQRERKLKQVQ